MYQFHKNYGEQDFGSLICLIFYIFKGLVRVVVVVVVVVMVVVGGRGVNVGSLSHHLSLPQF